MTKPPRLAVITSKTLRVFEGRKFLAEYQIDGELTAEDVEAVRITDNPFTTVQENQS